MTMLRHLFAILALPFTVTVVVPYLLLRNAGSGASLPGQVGGLVVIGAGLVLVIGTVRDFAMRGNGTLAPWDPPRRLVVTGIYRYARNPMISGVLLVLIGESLAFASAAVAAWAAVFFTINAIYIPYVEEAGLERRFGTEYADYRRHVPRWIPRLSPWQGKV